MVQGAELVRPGVAVLRMDPGDPVPTLPLRVQLPDGRTVQVREVVRADGDEPVVALLLAESLSAAAATPVATVETNWFCKLFPRLCR